METPQGGDPMEVEGAQEQQGAPAPVAGGETEGQAANPANPPAAVPATASDGGEAAGGQAASAAAQPQEAAPSAGGSEQPAAPAAAEAAAQVGSGAPQAPSAPKPADPAAGGAGGGQSQEDQGEDEGARKEELGVSIPVARVKRMMRCNPDKKKNFSKEAVQAVAAGMELFLADFAKTAYQFTADKKRKTLLIADVAECIRLVPRFEFLDGPGILPDVEDRQKRARGAAVVPPPAAPSSNPPAAAPMPPAAQAAPMPPAALATPLPPAQQPAPTSAEPAAPGPPAAGQGEGGVQAGMSQVPPAQVAVQ